MIRGVDDRFTISLDAGGGALYERGYKPYVNEAPLRETTAAALLILAGLEKSADSQKGINSVLDAMCGSGTFGLEALGISAGLPASPARSYPFEYWPSFRPGRFDFLKKEILSRLASPCKIVMSDTDDKNLDAARGNIKLFLNQNGLDRNAPDWEAKTVHADFFKGPAIGTGKTGDTESSNDGEASGNRLLILNPPYGLRLPLEDRLGFFRRLGNTISKEYKGCRWGIIVPGLECEKALNLHWDKKYLFKNGGFPVSFLVGQS